MHVTHLDGFGKYSATLRSSSEGRGGQAVSITIGQQLWSSSTVWSTAPHCHQGPGLWEATAQQQCCCCETWLFVQKHRNAI